MSLVRLLRNALRVGPVRAATQFFRTCDIKTGRLVGVDMWGNKYFESSEENWYRSRWIEPVNGKLDACDVPAEWHGWLHRITDRPPQTPEEMVGKERVEWMVPHDHNQTGGAGAFRTYNTTREKVELWNGN